MPTGMCTRIQSNSNLDFSDTESQCSINPWKRLIATLFKCFPSNKQLNVFGA